MRSFSIVVAITDNMGIGLNGGLPWKISADMKYFKKLTVGNGKNAVIMGRKTYESIGRDLPGRLNIVLSRKTGVNLQSVLIDLDKRDDIEEVFVIGGAEVYEEALKMKQCEKIYVTWVKKNESKIVVDTFFPRFSLKDFRCVSSTKVEENEYSINFEEYIRVVNKEEEQYLDMIRDVLENGEVRVDRTCVGTRSVFGRSMRFDLRDGRIPVFTTKRVFWRGVVEELLWFISGSTNAEILQEKGVKIWNGNSSREYLDSVGLKENEEGDLGPVYGFQWRHFGAEYKDAKSDYKGQGIDQLMGVIERIHSNPSDRRILMSAWNPVDLGKMALPPCHVMCQFYVSNDGELSCQIYQRSCDMGLGVPFNVTSYALLTRMIAYVCGLKCGELVYVMGDVHVYLNHIDALQEQLLRQPREFPKLEIRDGQERDIDKFEYSSFVLKYYQPYETIGMNMAV